MKSKKGRRREKVLQNAKDRKLAKGNPLVALQAHQRANRASNDTQVVQTQMMR